MSHAPVSRLAVNDLRRESADAVSLTFAIPGSSPTTTALPPASI